MLLEKFKNLSEDKKQHFIEVIYDSSQRVFGLLENLLQWASAQTGNIRYNPEAFDLGELVDANFDLVKDSIAEKEIKLIKNQPDDTWVFADRNMINAVVRNLLGNAVKYTEKGEISVNIETRRDSLEMSITDSGIGIPENKLSGIFEIDRKSSTEGTRGEKGSGLGLLICKEFVQTNGGEISIKSIEGEGTVFTFTIPRRA
jgi:signal transduction histidine kinase